ncbi:MAG TPA: hypothetical protein VIU12_13205 [Chryseolinea sp.]
MEITDEVRYGIPLGLPERFADAWFVERPVNAIFDYRVGALLEIFSNKTAVMRSA